MRLFFTCLLMFCFFGYGIADEPVVFIEIPGSKTDYCKHDKLILTGKCFFGTEDFVKHEWKSETNELIVDTKDQFAMLELIKAGQHVFTYTAWNAENKMATVSIKLNVLDLPDNQIESRKKFFTRLFGRDLPQHISVVQYNSANSYQWYHNNQAVNGATGAKFKAGEYGRYRVEITSAYGCKAVSEVYEIFDN